MAGRGAWRDRERDAPRLDDGHGALVVSESAGAAGPNHCRLVLGGGRDHSTAKSASSVDAVPRGQLPSVDTGQKQIEPRQAAADRFDAHGSELSIAGDWQIEAIVRQPGQKD